MGVDQSSFLPGAKVVGGGGPVAMPEELGPRNWGQLAKRGVVRSKVRRMVNLVGGIGAFQFKLYRVMLA